MLIESDLRTLHYVRAVDVQKEQLEGRLHARHVELEALNERLAQELEQTHRFSEALRQLTGRPLGSAVPDALERRGK